MKQPRRTQAERRDETREALVRAAVNVIARRGYEAATLQLIADEAGVSKGAVHHHFRAKHELAAPVVSACGTFLRRAASDAFHADAPPGERLKRAIRALWNARRSRAPESIALAELVSRGAHDEHIRAAIRAEIALAQRDVLYALETTARALGLRARVPLETLPVLFLAILEGASLHHTISDGDESAAGALDAFETLALGVFTA